MRKYCYNFPRPSVSVDIACLAPEFSSFKVLLIKRLNKPFKDCWALPGGFVDENESLEKAAYRELSEETSISTIDLFQFRAFGDPGRDPRGHTVSVVFFSILSNTSVVNPIAADDAVDAQWFSVDNLPEMAFDHAKIILELLQFIADVS